MAVALWESNARKSSWGGSKIKKILPCSKNLVKIANLVNIPSKHLIDCKVSSELFYEKITGKQFSNLSELELRSYFTNSRSRMQFQSKSKHERLIDRISSFITKLEKSNLYENCASDNAKLTKFFLTKLLSNLKIEIKEEKQP